MKSGEDYIGVSQLLEAGAIKFTSSEIASDSCHHVAEVLRENKENYKNKYCVIRTHCAEKDSDTIKSLASSIGYEYKSIFGGDGGNLDFMNGAPFKETIVHICGRFRMGQVVPKRHIAMVYEQSKNQTPTPSFKVFLEECVGTAVRELTPTLTFSPPHLPKNMFANTQERGLKAARGLIPFQPSTKQ